MADTKNKNRNTVQWKSEFIRVSETQLQMSLIGTFYPYDFRKQPLDIKSRPIGEAATNEAMHDFLDNQHGNFVFCTLYNYAPFAFLKSDEQGHFPNVKDYAFGELEPDEITRRTILNKIIQIRIATSKILDRIRRANLYKA